MQGQDPRRTAHAAIPAAPSSWRAALTWPHPEGHPVSPAALHPSPSSATEALTSVARPRPGRCATASSLALADEAQHMTPSPACGSRPPAALAPVTRWASPPREPAGISDHATCAIPGLGSKAPDRGDWGGHWAAARTETKTAVCLGLPETQWDDECVASVPPSAPVREERLRPAPSRPRRASPARIPLPCGCTQPRPEAPAPSCPKGETQKPHPFLPPSHLQCWVHPCSDSAPPVHPSCSWAPASARPTIW